MPRGKVRKIAAEEPSATTELPSFLDSVKCPICLDYAENAVETSCCGQVYCENCIEKLTGRNCPSCRKPGLRTSVSKVSRKIIGDLPIECPNSCAETVTRGTSERHKDICPRKEHPCPVGRCEFVGLKQPLIEHEATEHGNEVFCAMKMYSTSDQKFFCPMKNCVMKEGKTRQQLETHLVEYHAKEKGDFERKRNCPFDNCRNDQPFNKEHILLAHGKSKEIFNKIFHSEDGPIKILNAGGRWAEMAKNGKFYCGHKNALFIGIEDEAKKKTVTNVDCTLESGLNCDYCMKLDVTMNLPHSHFVNHGAGHVSVPLICNHVVKGSEYFGNNARSALCRRDTCGNSPQLCCGGIRSGELGKNVDCKFVKRCVDCDQLVYVLSFTKKDGNLLVDYDYYKIVWEKKGAP